MKQPKKRQGGQKAGGSGATVEREERIRGKAEKQVAAGSRVGLECQTEEFGPQWGVTGAGSGK